LSPVIQLIQILFYFPNLHIDKSVIGIRHAQNRDANGRVCKYIFHCKKWAIKLSDLNDKRTGSTKFPKFDQYKIAWRSFQPFSIDKRKKGESRNFYKTSIDLCDKRTGLHFTGDVQKSEVAL